MKRWPYAAAAVAILIVIAVLWVVVGHDPDPSAGREVDDGGRAPGHVIVPDVVRMSVDDARTAVEGRYLKVTLRAEQPGEAVAGGVVVSQDPAGRTIAVEGSTVTLVVGRTGPVRRPV
jgi:hypothetical protein